MKTSALFVFFLVASAAREYYVIIGPTHPPTPKSLVIIRHHWLDPPTHPRILRNIDTAPYTTSNSLIPGPLGHPTYKGLHVAIAC